MHSIIAASQDGLVKAEYQSAKKMARKWNIDQAYVDQCVDVVRMERLFQTTVTKYLNGTSNKI